MSDTFEPDNGVSGDAELAPDAPAVQADDDELQQLATSAYSEWTWWVYRIRDRSERGPRGEVRVVCTKITGPLDIMGIRQEFGGGVFEVWGFFGPGNKLRKKKRFEIAGPRKVYPDETPGVATVSTAPVRTAAGAPELELRLDRLERTLERALERLSAPPVQQGLSLEQALKLLERLQPQQQQHSPSELMAEIFGAFKMGAEMRSDAERPEPSPWLAAIERLAPSLERLAGAAMARASATRPAAASRPAPPGPPARPPSSAEVVPDGLPSDPPGWVASGAPAAPPAPAPAAPDPEMDIGQVRFAALVDALARAIEDEADPAGFATTTENLLTVPELEQLESLSVDVLMAQLQATTYGVFHQDAARPFVESVLMELKSA